MPHCQVEHHKRLTQTANKNPEQKASLARGRFGGVENESVNLDK